jgi:GT2 family glycosyltransferase
MALDCVASILENKAPSFELLLVDQSDDPALESAVRSLPSDPRLLYLKTGTRGLAFGRNLGIERARSDLIACTDDDCVVPSNWVEQIRASLMLDSRIAAVYGNVRPAPHNRQRGFIPGCLRAAPFIAKNIRHQHRVDGMAGNMGIRRSAWKRLGEFDEMLGAGSRFFAGEDLDFSIRALNAGFFVYANTDFEVIHHGFRSWTEGPHLIEGYLHGIGAMVAKHLKCRNCGILSYLAHLSMRWAFIGPVVEFGHQPSRLLRLKAFLRGFAAGIATPVERRRSLFKAADVR